MESVKEIDLNFAEFACCGDEDLFPFKCSSCGRVMVYCYECDTLYPDLRDTKVQEAAANSFDPERPIFGCPACGHAFEYKFMSNPSYLVSPAEWRRAGHERLLKDVP